MPDVFPRRNLSADSEPWGREVEARIVTLEGVAASAKSNVAGQNRTTASSLSDLARQLNRLDVLYRSIPKPAQATGSSGGFGLSAGWGTIAEAKITVPDKAARADVFAMASGFLTYTSGSVVAGQMRLVAGGNASPGQPWATYSDAGGFHASITTGFTWSIPVTPGTLLSIALQVNPDNAATWGVNAANYATVAAMVTFTG